MNEWHVVAAPPDAYMQDEGGNGETGEEDDTEVTTLDPTKTGEEDDTEVTTLDPTKTGVPTKIG